ncbi:hypothetical protein E2C01_007752 [Portunus trituberculatus]|uniref:Uncharacterized protein n=1 Tax=Portunus trituberculatus TaxID=210409 RepID=A0A5B7CZ03_PORTR|nr:hypothetical protein [Portunus trituberculatus]
MATLSPLLVHLPQYSHSISTSLVPSKYDYHICTLLASSTLKLSYFHFSDFQSALREEQSPLDTMRAMAGRRPTEALRVVPSAGHAPASLWREGSQRQATHTLVHGQQ